MDGQALRLHEELLLLALHDEKGTMPLGDLFSHAAAGGMLCELALAGRIELDKSKKKPEISVTDTTMVGEPLLDEWLMRIRESPKKCSVQSWVGKIAGSAGLAHRIAEPLYMRGILRKEDGRVLFVFKRRVYPTGDPGPERVLLERLRAGLNGDDSDERALIALALADAGGFLDEALTRDEIKTAKKRLEALRTRNSIVAETAEVMDAVRAAIMIAAM
jgi:golgi phosphoprotein 3